MFTLLCSTGAAQAAGDYLQPLGDEQRIVLPLGGDQVYPSISFSDGQALLVWQDNGIDRYDVGLAGCQLDGDLHPISNILKINRYRWGDQTEPEVTWLPDGGAAVVFDGCGPRRRGQNGPPDAFIRYVRSNGRVTGSDYSLTPRRTRLRSSVVIDRPTWRNNKLVQRRWRIPVRVTIERDQTQEPQVIPFAERDVLLAYTGVRNVETNTYVIQPKITLRRYRGEYISITNDVRLKVVTKGHTQRDIFIQEDRAYRRPNGRGETMANQFSAGHQRQPSLAGLSNGGFVLAWVSEDYVGTGPDDPSSVVIRARVFQADGQPAGDEFVVNTEDQICARPTVAARPDGGFMVVWNQRDEERRNGWDIYARQFDVEGAPWGPAFQVNETAYGDQFLPVVAAAEQTQMIVWTSLGQDGSREGVFGRLAAVGGVLGSEIQVNTTTALQQMHPRVVARHANDFSVLWTSFHGQDGFDIMTRDFRAMAPLYAPEAPTVTALDESRLEVAWSPVAVASLLRYELFMDGAVVPQAVSGLTYTADNLAPQTTHSFRLAYVLNDGRRSLLSELVYGVTLSSAQGSAAGGSTSAGTGETIPSVGGGGSGRDDSALAPLLVELRGAGQGAELSWNTRPGVRYQVQISDDLARWMDYGPIRTAEGERDSILINPKEEMAWFRVVQLP